MGEKEKVCVFVWVCVCKNERGCLWGGEREISARLVSKAIYTDSLAQVGQSFVFEGAKTNT